MEDFLNIPDPADILKTNAVLDIAAQNGRILVGKILHVALMSNIVTRSGVRTIGKRFFNYIDG